MRIKIKTDERKNITLWFPTVLLINHVTALIIAPLINIKLRDTETKLKVSSLWKIVNIIYRHKLRGGGKLEVVDIQNSDAVVKIIL